MEAELPVLVVTKSTGEALVSLARDFSEARVVFGGTDELGEGQWVVEGDVRNRMPLEWENSITRSVCIYTSERVYCV